MPVRILTLSMLLMLHELGTELWSKGFFPLKMTNDCNSESMKTGKHEGHIDFE